VRLPICCLSLTRLLWLERFNVLRIEGKEIFTILGELWRAVLAFAPEETDPRDGEPMIEVGRKVTVVGFDEEETMQVVPVDRTYGPGHYGP
jgi:hypothetical protein